MNCSGKGKNEYKKKYVLSQSKGRLSLHMSSVAHQAGVYLWFLLDEATRSVCTPLDGMHAPGWRETL